MTVNTKIINQAFEYLEPKDIQEVLHLLKKHGPAARILAGGTDLLLQIKQEKTFPSYLINISRIGELQYLKEDEGLGIGSATKLRDVRDYCSKEKKYMALHEAISQLGKPQVWNMGTIGGNLCNGSPAADTAPPLLTLAARVTLVSNRGERTLELADFFQGVNRTAMSQDEMMTDIHLDPIPEGSGSAFRKIARVGADISKITCAVHLVRQGENCLLCRIAFGAVAPVPMRAGEAESHLKGKKINEALIKQAGKKVAEEIRPIDDIRSTAEYRRDVSAVLFRDVFWKAWERAGGEGA